MSRERTCAFQTNTPREGSCRERTCAFHRRGQVWNACMRSLQIRHVREVVGNAHVRSTGGPGLERIYAFPTNTRNR
jgi:hypothetical protein